jgi:non-specific serine/threonine protein kinase
VLGDSTYRAAWEAGKAMTLAQTVEYALAVGGAPGPDRVSPAVTESRRLTPRERQVAALVADGLRNKEIAVRLGIAERTAETHVQRLLEKLGVSSRGRVAGAIASRERREKPPH